MYLSCWWNLLLFWYFGTIVINEVEFGAAALTHQRSHVPNQIADHKNNVSNQRGQIATSANNLLSSGWNPIFSKMPSLFSSSWFPSPTIRSTSARQSSTPDLPTSSSKFVQFHLFSTLLNLIGPWCSVPSFRWNCPKSAINFRNAATCIWPAHSHSKIHSFEIRWQTSNLRW